MYCRGMGSGPGDSAESHRSVQVVRSCRAGFPVMDRERTVSRELAARRCSAAGGQHGHRGHRVDDFGDEDHGRNLSRVASRFIALSNDEVDSLIDLALGLSDAADERRHLHAVLVGQGHDVGGGGPRALTSKLIGCSSATSTCGRAPS